MFRVAGSVKARDIFKAREDFSSLESNDSSWPFRPPRDLCQRVSYICTIAIWNTRTRVLSRSAFGLLFDVNHLLSCYDAAPVDGAIRCAWNTRAATTLLVWVDVQQVRGLCFLYGNACVTRTYVREAAASRMMKGFQHCLPTRMSHWPNHKIVIEVSDVATLELCMTNSRAFLHTGHRT